MKEETAKIVAAYVANNPLSVSELADFIRATYAALTAVLEPGQAAIAGPGSPAVPIKKSVTRDAVICLDCGKSFSMMKRHLQTDHDLSPEGYRSKWGLSQDYPMVAPAYAEKRSVLAKKIGLGMSRKRKASPQPVTVAPAPAKRGRKKAAVA